MIFSKIFNTHKGRMSQTNETICEVHQQIYDILVLELQDRPELLKKLIPLIEVAFSQGISIVHRLIRYKLSTRAIIKSNVGRTKPEANKKRKKRIYLERNERIRLVNLEKELRAIKISIGSKAKYCEK